MLEWETGASDTKLCESDTGTCGAEEEGGAGGTGLDPADSSKRIVGSRTTSRFESSGFRFENSAFSSSRVWVPRFGIVGTVDMGATDDEDEDEDDEDDEEDEDDEDDEEDEEAEAEGVD